MPNDRKEICMLNVVIPDISDERAIACKKKIEDALADIPNVQIRFSIMTAPKGTPNVPQIQ